MAEDLLAAVDVDRVVDHRRTASRIGVSVRRMWRRSWRSAQIRARDLLGGPVLDVVLELVDLVVQLVDQGEVTLGDLVDQAVGEHPDGDRPASEAS